MQAVPHLPSLITHSTDFLREALRRGEWTDVLPSERALCARLRISRPTLRAVLLRLEKEGMVSGVENKRRRVLAGGLKQPPVRTARTIGLLSPVPAQMMPPFVLFWLDALRELLGEAGYQMDLHIAPACFSSRPAAALKKLTQRAPAAAWVLFRSTPLMQHGFAGQDVPAVVAGSCAGDVRLPSVDIDYRATCRHAAAMLARKGHRRIALLLPDSGHRGDVESEHGFREALAGGQAAPQVLRHQQGAAQLCRCLDEALSRRDAPTAFLVARSMHTLTVVTHLLRLGRRLPQDTAVVSRDDDAYLDHVVPKVSRYAADPAKFARRLARLVLELAQTGRTSTTPVRLMPDFRRGETV